MTLVADDQETGEAQAKALAVTASRSGRAFRLGIWHLLRVGLRGYFRIRTHGAHHLDTPGPLIIAPVHRSNLDAPIVATRTKRMIYALGKRSLFSSPAFGWIVAALGAFPVNRGAADRDALRAAQELLEDGGAIIVFPEGTRQVGTDVGEVFDGAAFLSARTGAPVIPIGIAGTEAAMPPGARFPRRTRVAVAIGAPIEPLRSESGKVSLKQRRAFTADLKAALQQVFDEAQIEAEQV